jgi:hypothetical protein
MERRTVEQPAGARTLSLNVLTSVRGPAPREPGDLRVGGIVAKIREYAIVGPSAQMPVSDRQPKQLVDKLQLRERVTFV